MTIADEIYSVFQRRGESAYLGEPVSQLQHALQAAHFAQEDNAAPALVVAALLHDIGHLLEDVPEDVAEQGIDARHEEIGDAWLSQRFGPAVRDPVRLHVAAKRYLCATEQTYFDLLSPASVLSLRLQGGPMSDCEVKAFESEPFFRDAVTLRRWDDRAKIETLVTAPLANYRELIERVLLGPSEL